MPCALRAVAGKFLVSRGLQTDYLLERERFTKKVLDHFFVFRDRLGGSILARHLSAFNLGRSLDFKRR